MQPLVLIDWRRVHAYIYRKCTQCESSAGQARYNASLRYPSQWATANLEVNTNLAREFPNVRRCLGHTLHVPTNAHALSLDECTRAASVPLIERIASDRSHKRILHARSRSTMYFRLKALLINQSG